FRKYFAPTPGRAREAAWVALAAVTSVAVLLSFGMANGTAALLVMNSLGPSAVSNWRSLPRRLAFVVVPALIVLPVGGFLLQLPPLLVPTLFATITALLYFHPETRYGFDSLAALLILLNPIYDGALDPLRFAASAGATAAEAAVAAIVATVFFEFARPGGIRLRLSNSLAGGFRDDRARLASAAARARAGQPTDASADLPRPTAIPLLDMLRQEGIADSEERVLVLLTSTCERSGSFVATLETIAGGGPIRMSPGVAAAADALVAGLDRALDGFVEAAGHWRSDEPLSPRPADPWPDLQALRGDLEREQQLAIEARSAGHPTDGAPSERERERRAAWIAALGGLAQVLHTSPADLRALVHDDPRDLLEVPEIAAPTESLDPIPLRYALQVALTMMICFHLGLATHLPAPITFLWSPLMVAQTSFGATVRKARLRALGVIAGGLLSLALVIGFMPATDDLALWLVALFAVLFACQYAALGEPRWWYVGYQAAVTVVVLTVGEGPVVSVDGVLWRAWGLVLSLAVLFAVFRLLPPDTAARQLVRRWRDLGRILARFLPGPGEPLPDMAELVRTRLRVGRIGADLLRLADELRVEGDQEIDPTAAIEAGGLAMRSTYRAGLVARARVLAPPDGSPDDPAVLAADADAAAAAHARSIRDVVETAARRADRFGWDTKAPRDDEGREDPLATTALPDLGAAVEDLSRRLEKRGVREMAGRTAGQATEIVSSIENLRRLSVLLPRLEEALGRALGSRATALLAVLVLFSGCASMIPPLSPLRAIDPESLAPKQANRTWEPEPGVVPTPAPSPTTESSEPRASRSTRTDAAASPDASKAREAGADTTSTARGEAGSGTSTGPLDLPELIDLGLRESPSTRAAWEASRGAAARVGRSLEPYYPTLRTSARLAPNERLLFQDTPQTLIAHQRAWEPQVSLAYTLLDFGRRARTAEVARQRLTAANFSFNRELQRVAFEVSHAYFLLDAAIALEQAATENVELARRVRE
ncbi:MAG: TolC family protein, partial [Alphaproteobacteria bacterium]